TWPETAGPRQGNQGGEADVCGVRAAWPSRKERRPREAAEFGVEASACSVDAAIRHRGDDRGNDAGNRLAAALGTRFFGGRSAQAPQAEAHLEESGRYPRL